MTARLWDTQSGELLREFVGHEAVVRAVAITPDKRYVLTAGDDETARLWDVAKGEEIRQFAGHSEGIRAAAMSPDGRFVLTGSGDHTARLWNAATASGAILGGTSELSRGETEWAFYPT